MSTDLIKFADLPERTLICQIVPMRSGDRPPFRAIAWEKCGTALSVREIVEHDDKEEAARILSIHVGDLHCVCPVEEGPFIRYLAPDAISLAEAMVAAYGIPLRRDDPKPPKVLGSGETAVDREGALELREFVITVRDEALKQGEMVWAVNLSHVVAFMSNAIPEIFGTE
jgi:hypothetical protein